MTRLSKIFNIERFFTEKAVEKAKLLVPFFYYFLFFYILTKFVGFETMLNRFERVPEVAWSIAWVQYLPSETAVMVILSIATFGTLIAALFYKYPFARIIGFISALQYHGFLDSPPGTSHQFDMWIWIAFLLMFIPNVWKKVVKKIDKKKLLLVFWIMTAFLLLTYSLSGIGKVYGALDQFMQGNATIFSPDAGALHIADHLLTTDQKSFFGPFLVKHPLLAWLGLLGTLYLQLTSIVVAFRPELHRIWGIGLISFHLGTQVFMAAIFTLPIPLIFILLIESPFREGKDMELKDYIKNLPLINSIMKISKA